MRRTISTSAILTGIFAALLVLAGALPAVSADSPPIWTYFSTSGGTQANLIGTTVSTDLTGASTLAGTAFTGSKSNDVARTSVPGLLNVGGISSSQAASPFGSDGLQITSKARIASVDLLNGAIKIGAVEVTNIARATPSGFSSVLNSQLASLTIDGKAYPLSADPNTKVEIPGLAEVVINEQKSNAGSSGIATKVTALRVTLLKDVAGAKVGSTIKVATSSINILNGALNNSIAVGGFSYGTAVKVAASDARVAVPPTAFVSIPSYGTGGKFLTNSTANVDVPQGLVKIGAIESRVSGLSDVGKSDAYAENQTARVNVLGGRITADAINVKSHVAKSSSGHVEEQKLEFLRLKIMGKTIPADVKPNTRISVAGLGRITVNEQVSQPGFSQIIGVRVILSTKTLGLPAGADIQIAVARTFTASS